MFNEGYTASAGTRLGRVDLAHEAIRLARLARVHNPQDPEVAGLLALMLLTEARRDARTDAQVRLVPLERQDRARWDHGMIEEGRAIIDGVWPLRTVGPYQVQAAIAAVHATAASDADTDWPQIAALYLWLERLAPTGPVRLARVVAVSRAFGPDAPWTSSTPSTASTGSARLPHAATRARRTCPPARRLGPAHRRRCGVPLGSRPYAEHGRDGLPARPRTVQRRTGVRRVPDVP
ncbi:DUF6596 domain-containing protein [Oerskovia sp. M15]